MSTQWEKSPLGQHIELGIGENNLFLNLAALGLSETLFGARLLPIGTLYDTFIARGLDALNYACYMDARFMVVATPSGISLAPEGGAHQSISTPPIGISQPGMLSFEPAFVDEVAEIMRFGFEHMQAVDGGAIYLRLSTRLIKQPKREMTEQLRQQVRLGGYWMVEPTNGPSRAVVATGATMPEALKAVEKISQEHPDIALMCMTSADRLFNQWQNLERSRLKRSDDGVIAHIEELLEPLADNAQITSLIDGHPLSLAWLGSVRGHSLIPLGVNEFGQSGNLHDLYETHGIDADTVTKAASRLSNW